MAVEGNQRWELGRSSYRPAGEVINTSEYDVGEISRETARTFVLEHHYSHEFPARRFSYGLHRHGNLVGVAVFSTPCSNKVLTNVFPVDPLEATELGRFVLLDEVPGNGETWTLARCFELLRKRGIRGVVSFSDPVPRRTLLGQIVAPGHTGTIYQASSATYLGRGDSRTLRLLPDGTIFSHRTEQKIRNLETGWKGGVEKLCSYGAAMPTAGEDLRTWLALWLCRLTRPLPHPGNHKYAFAIDKRMRDALGDARQRAQKRFKDELRYPKAIDQVAWKSRK